MQNPRTVHPACVVNQARGGGVPSSSLWFGKLCCKRVIMVPGILDAQYTLALQ